MNSALVTGGAGFVGSHLVDKLIAENWHVTVLDNFDPFYDSAIKLDNVALHRNNARFRLIDGDLRDRDAGTHALAASAHGNSAPVPDGAGSPIHIDGSAGGPEPRCGALAWPA